MEREKDKRDYRKSFTRAIVFIYFYTIIVTIGKIAQCLHKLMYDNSKTFA